MTPAQILPFVAVLATCGGIAVVDGTSGGGGTSAADGASQTGSTGTSTSSWQPTAVAAGGPCLSCSQWLAACDGAHPCPDPVVACSGAAFERANALFVCLCTGCGQLCNGNCLMFNDSDQNCLECQLQVATHPCGFEQTRCREG